MPNLDRLTSSSDPLAAQVADVLRATFDPATKRRETLAQLLQMPLYRGDVASPLTPDLTAVLLDALGEKDVPRRAEVLEMLFTIAVGFDTEASLAHRIDESRFSETVGEAFTLGELRRPIVARGKEIAAFAGDADPSVRGEAAKLLSALPEHRELAVASLEKALSNEKDAVAQYFILFALASHGVRKEVPEPPAKNAVASILARIVRPLHGGALDFAATVDARKLPMTVSGLLGPMHAVQTIIYANVGEAVRRGDPAALVPFADDQTAVALFAALWPGRHTPIEPRSSLTEDERRWLLPIYQTGNVKGLIELHFSRAGIVRGAHALRLLGLEKGPADAYWLLARRVVDERASLDDWKRAIEGKSDDDIVAILRDLASYRVEQSWPLQGLPYPLPSAYETCARYFTLVRATLERLGEATLAKMRDDASDAFHATALAISIDRGASVEEGRIETITKLVQREQGANDIASLRKIVEALSPAHRVAVLKGVRPTTSVNGATAAFMLTSLWFYADLAPPEILALLVNDIAAVHSMDSSLTKPKNPYEAAMAQSKREAVHSTFRTIGALAAAPLRDALGALKPKVSAQLLEIALAGAEGNELPQAPAEPQTAPKAKSKAKKK